MTDKSIIYQKINQRQYIVRANIDFPQREVGSLVMDVDGYFYFWPVDNNGAWSSYHLREVANKLDEINKEWHQQVEKEFSK